MLVELLGSSGEGGLFDTTFPTDVDRLEMVIFRVVALMVSDMIWVIHMSFKAMI